MNRLRNQENNHIHNSLKKKKKERKRKEIARNKPNKESERPLQQNYKLLKKDIRRWRHLLCCALAESIL
jgi:hypothetical protein